MAFDGIITKKIIEELNCSIIGGKINKVFEPNKNEIILGIYCDGKNYALNIDINALSGITAHSIQKMTKGHTSNMVRYLLDFEESLASNTFTPRRI